MALRRLPMIRRGLVLPSAALVAAFLALGGCSVIEKAHSAAIVDGRPITDAEVAQATKEYNTHVAKSPQQRIPEARALTYLMLSSFVLDQVQKSGSWKPDDRYNGIIASIPNASPSTVALIKTAQAASALTQQDITAIVDRLKAARIELDPRYGTFDPTSGGSVPTVENWIKPPATATPTPSGR